MATDQKRRAEDGCAHHEMMLFKTNLTLAFMGGQLLGVMLIAIASAWGIFKIIPDFKASVVAEMEKTQRRAEVVEYRINNIEKVANKYLADVAEYESKGSKP